jgi:nitrous oxidase accessory protein
MTRPRRGRGARALALLAGLALGGAAAAEPAAVPAPPACRRLAAGDSLSEALAAASDGDALCLAPGDWQGPVRLARRVALWGPRGAVIHSAGEGTTVSIEAAGAALLGVTVDGSGGRFDLLDAAVRVSADDARVEGVAIRGALFGIPILAVIVIFVNHWLDVYRPADPEFVAEVENVHAQVTQGDTGT